MKLRIEISILSDETKEPLYDEHGKPLTGLVEMQSQDTFAACRLDEIYIPLIWAACKYYDIKERIRLLVYTAKYDQEGLQDQTTEVKRVDPLRQKVLQSPNCHNCSNYDEDGCTVKTCRWKPRRGDIEWYDHDEHRCSECGCLVSSLAIRCPNCMAVFC